MRKGLEGIAPLTTQSRPRCLSGQDERGRGPPWPPCPHARKSSNEALAREGCGGASPRLLVLVRPPARLEPPHLAPGSADPPTPGSEAPISGAQTLVLPQDDKLPGSSPAHRGQGQAAASRDPGQMRAQGISRRLQASGSCSTQPGKGPSQLVRPVLKTGPTGPPAPTGPAPTRSEPRPCRGEKPLLAKCRFLQVSSPH